MTKQEIFDTWLTYAERDLDAAGVMFESGRWFYVVFMCQQSMEKLVKGLYTQFIDEAVPRTHNITALMERFEDRLLSVIPSEYNRLMKTLSAYYVSERYPDYISKAGEQINKDEASAIFRQTKEAFAWLLTLKP